VRCPKPISIAPFPFNKAPLRSLSAGQQTLLHEDLGLLGSDTVPPGTFRRHCFRSEHRCQSTRCTVPLWAPHIPPALLNVSTACQPLPDSPLHSCVGEVAEVARRLARWYSVCLSSPLLHGTVPTKINLKYGYRFCRIPHVSP